MIAQICDPEDQMKPVRSKSDFSVHENVSLYSWHNRGGSLQVTYPVDSCNDISGAHDMTTTNAGIWHLPAKLTIQISDDGLVLRHRDSKIPIIGTEFPLSDLKGWKCSKLGYRSKILSSSEWAIVF